VVHEQGRLGTSAQRRTALCARGRFEKRIPYFVVGRLRHIRPKVMRLPAASSRGLNTRLFPHCLFPHPLLCGLSTAIAATRACTTARITTTAAPAPCSFARSTPASASASASALASASASTLASAFPGWRLPSYQTFAPTPASGAASTSLFIFRFHRRHLRWRSRHRPSPTPTDTLSSISTPTPAPTFTFTFALALALAPALAPAPAPRTTSSTTLGTTGLGIHRRHDLGQATIRGRDPPRGGFRLRPLGRFFGVQPQLAHGFAERHSGTRP
jgi:hypothetical protein